MSTTSEQFKQGCEYDPILRRLFHYCEQQAIWELKGNYNGQSYYFTSQDKALEFMNNYLQAMMRQSKNISIFSQPMYHMSNESEMAIRRSTDDTQPKKTLKILAENGGCCLDIFFCDRDDKDDKDDKDDGDDRNYLHRFRRGYTLKKIEIDHSGKGLNPVSF